MVKSHTKKKNTNTKAGLRPAIAKPKKARPGPRRRSRRRPNHEERECAKHYAQSQLDPFNTPSGACVPILPCLESAKRKVFARGVGYVQPNGFGGISAATSLASDLMTVAYTTGAGTGETIASTTIGQAACNSELTSTDWEEYDVQTRLVACGVRIRYTGKQIDMCGSAYALEEPHHKDASGFSVQDLLSFDKVKTVPFNRDWTVVSWQPVLPTETSYFSNAYCSPYLPAVSPLVILIRCQGGGEILPFEWEWYAHYEAIGSSARGKSHSHMAPIEGPKVMAALQQAPSSLFDDVSNQRVSAGSLADQMIDYGSSWQMGDLARRVANTAVGAITSRAAAQYMSGGLAALTL